MKMSDLHILEQTSKLLEPSADQFNDWFEHLGQKSNQFLSSVPNAPACFEKSHATQKLSEDLFALSGAPFASVLNTRKRGT